jgi:glycosyltransferase involved in cell wall biosynthesis
MRILHYIEAVDFRNGGPPRAVVDQVATMKARGHDAGLATTDVRDIPTPWRQPTTSTDPVPAVVELPPTSGPLRRLSRKGVRRITSAIKDYDVVHLHGVWESSNLQIAAACRRARVPYVVSLRGMLDDWAMQQKPLKKRLFLLLGGRRFLRSAAAVHCTAIHEMTQSRARFGDANAVVIPNLVDLRPYTTIPVPKPAQQRWPHLDQGELRVLFLSRLHPGKGVDILIEAVSDLRRRTGRDVRLLIAGDGPPELRRSLEDLARDRGLEGSITWIGFVTGEIKLSLFAAADVFALPTTQENFGFVLFESLAAGTPVVTTNLVDTRDEIRESGGGTIVSRTIEDFSEALEAFLDQRRNAAEMGDRGRSWTLEHLSHDRVAGQFEDLYQSVVSDRR